MIQVELDYKDWQQVINLLGSANAPWIITNPLILRIVKQVETKKQPDQTNITLKGDGYGIPTEPH